MERQFRIIEDNIRRIRAEIQDAAVKAGRNPADIALMAVTKTQNAQLVNCAIRSGVSLLGENRAQELVEKFDDYLAADIHFIGHLQTNKVRQIVDKVSMIHSLDSIRLAKEIDTQCAKLSKVMEVLIEVNIAGEDSKEGVDIADVEKLVRETALLNNLHIRGLMAIPPAMEDALALESYFSKLQQLSVDIKDKKIDNVSMDVLSMGMSGDYTLAIKHGSNIIRLGGAIFGPRL